MRDVWNLGLRIVGGVFVAAIVITVIVLLFVAVGLMGHEAVAWWERPSVQDGPVAIVSVNGGEYKVAVFPTPATTLAAKRHIDTWLEDRSGSEISRQRVPTSERKCSRDFTAVVFCATE